MTIPGTNSENCSIIHMLCNIIFDVAVCRSLQQQRRGRYLRDQRSAFDLLQSELEAIVETLSDVVARRRLRAGRDQISLVTRAARSKRIELESVIVTGAINQQVCLFILLFVCVFVYSKLNSHMYHSTGAEESQ